METPIQIEKFKSGFWGKGTSYNFFIPEKVNRQWLWQDATISELLEKASLQLGELNSFARFVPNIDLFIYLYVTKESVISSKIEGTQTNIDEALLPKEDISPERRDDWQEVQNYTEALNQAIQDLGKLPLSSRLLREAHKRLLQGVRGEHKLPGEFRSSQNWIGGASLADATFIPPVHTLVGELMGDLENFLHNDAIHVPKLIRVAIAHYQFETIHPFLDGNGRIGRLLITLYLVDQKLLEKPILYLSSFFERNKNLYYDNLMQVRIKSDLLHWLRYFLVGIEETARQGVQTLKNIIHLKHNLEADIHSNWGKRSKNGYILLQYLFKVPIIRVKTVQTVCSLSAKASGELIDLFIEKGILKESTGYSRNRVFIFESYLNQFKM